MLTLIHYYSITFLSLREICSSTDFDELFTNDPVLAGVYLPLPTTSFFLIYSPNEISHYLLCSVPPTIFLVSIAPKNAIGF